MIVYFDYTTVLRPGAVQLPSRSQQEIYYGDLSGGVTAFTQYLNPGHGGTSESLGYDLTYWVNGTTGTPITFSWQYRPAGTTAWTELESTAITVTEQTTGLTCHTVGLSTANMAMPVSIKTVITASVATYVSVRCGNYDVLDEYLTFRSQGHITV